MAEHHIIPPKYYVVNAAILTVLMILTVVASRFDLGGGINGLNYFVAIMIAVFKASFIIAIFMGLRWSTKLVKLFALAAIFWLVIMLAFTLTDAISLEEKPEWGTPFLIGDEVPEWSARNLPAVQEIPGHHGASAGAHGEPVQDHGESGSQAGQTGH